MKLAIDNGMLLARFGYMESMRLIKEAGFDCVDMTYYMSSVNAAPLGENYREDSIKLRAYLDELGLECNQAHAPFVYGYGDGFSEENANYRAIVHSIESASILGAKIIVVHSVGHRVDGKVCFDREYNLAYYRSLIPYCERFGIKVAVENLVEHVSGGFVGRLGTPEELSDFVRELGSDCFCACLDTGHASLAGVSPEAFVEGMSSDMLKVLHVHDGDYMGDKHTLPYLLDFKWKDIMGALKKIGYDGELTFEILNYFKNIPAPLIPEALRFAEMTGRYLIEEYERA